ncbi:GNAT family acetyltransferase Nat4 [Pyronema omphalodes]|nr:GNAT family acetyltransferase Nat4 [Pyronema omphalodes]
MAGMAGMEEMEEFVDIEAHNGLSLEEIRGFLPQVVPLGITLHTAQSMTPAEFLSCFNLVEGNMKPMYLRSTIGWSASEKKKEMEHPAMRFLLLPDGEGFASFMVTEEEGEEVVYCYELQLAETARNTGKGAKLMQVLEGFGHNVGLRKAMLTVFSENEGAIRFYRKNGYEIDPISPTGRVTRSGKVRPPSYYIFSKEI